MGSPADPSLPSTLARTRGAFRDHARAAGLLDAEITVLARPLTPEEAIGEPGRRDYPILVGKERVVEATLAGARGQAFTDSPREFIGPLSAVIELPLQTSAERAIYVAALNALSALRGLQRHTVHCKDDEPELCGRRLATTLRERYGQPRVGLIGLNPAIAEHLVQEFGPARVRITDLNPDQVGRERLGVPIWDGAEQTGALIDFADVILFTGTTLINDTYDAIRQAITDAGKVGIVYGMTAAGVSALLDIDRLCPCAHDGASALDPGRSP